MASHAYTSVGQLQRRTGLPGRVNVPLFGRVSPYPDLNSLYVGPVDW